MPGRRQHGEGSVYQRGRDGRWVATVDLGYRSGSRWRPEFTGRTSAEAIEKRQKFLDLRREGFTMPRGRQPTVDEWMRHWHANIIRRRVQVRTWLSYRSRVDLICDYFARVPLLDLDEDRIDEWHRHLEFSHVSPRTGRPLAPSTINQAHRVLSLALRTAVTRKRIPRNPAASRDVSPPAPEPPEVRPLEDDEVELVIATCAGWRTGPRHLVGMAAGTRQGETLGMLWPYVHGLDDSTCEIEIAWQVGRLPWQHGCEDPHACGERLHVWACPPRGCPKIRAAGVPHACIPKGDPRCCPPGCTAHARRCPLRRDGGLRLMRPKTDASRRRAPVGGTAAAALRAWKDEQRREREEWGAGWGGWHHDGRACPGRPLRGEHVCTACGLPARPGLVVWTQASGRPLDPAADNADWTALQEAAGVQDPRRVHDTRHGAATWLLEGGTDPRVVQELMGWASAAMLQRYQHVRVKLRREGAEVIDRRMRGPR